MAYGVALLICALTALAAGWPREANGQDLDESRRIAIAAQLAASSVVVRVGPEAGSGFVVRSQSTSALGTAQVTGDGTYQVIALGTPVTFSTQTTFWVVYHGTANYWTACGDGANPEATVELRDGPRRVRARAAAGEERERLWARWAEIDRGLDGYAARRSRPTAVVVFEPVEEG